MPPGARLFEMWIMRLAFIVLINTLIMQILGFAGWSGSGKTALLEKVIGVLESGGMVVSLIKHAHHDFEIDHPGKDSYRHRQAGCREVLVTSAKRWAVIHELQGRDELTLSDALAQLSPCDLVLLEGFKREPVAKIEIYRPEVGKPTMYPNDPHIIAVASNVALATNLPQLDINQPEMVANFIRAWMQAS